MKRFERSNGLDIALYKNYLYLTYSNEPNFINNVLLVAKEYFHFKLSNVTKRANLYGIVLFPHV